MLRGTCPICGREVVFLSKWCSILTCYIHISCCTKTCPLRYGKYCLAKVILKLVRQGINSVDDLSLTLGLEQSRLITILKMLKRLGYLSSLELA